MVTQPAQAVPPLRLAVLQIDGLPQALDADRRWSPSEPLLDPTTLSPPLNDRAIFAAHLFAASAGDNAQRILQRIHEIGTDVARARLSEILTFVRDQRADLVVLPEYLVPLACLDVLLGFSHGQVIVAGMGVLRNREDVNALLRYSTIDVTPDELIGRNIAVVVSADSVQVVTKRTLAQHEVATSGRGPAIFTVTLGSRTIRLGVAICMDYLYSEADLRENGADIVCIPAYSANSAAFVPEAPRDYVRLFSNCAAYGGSTIFAPSLRGPVFTDRRGVLPIAAGYEGVIIVEFDAFEQRPRALRRTENRVAVRAELIPRGTDHEVKLEAARQLGDLVAGSALESVADLPTRLGRWLEHTSGDSPLRQSLEEYRRALAQQLDDRELYAVLGTHATVAPGGRAFEVRSKQARFVVRRVGELMAAGLDVPFLGTALDAYSAIAAKAPDQAQIVRTTTGERWSFSLALGTFESVKAALTLPRQLNFLRAVSELPPGEIVLTYRLHSETNPHGPDPSIRFDVIVEGAGDTLSAEQVEGQLRSMFVESWAISGSDESADLPDNAFAVRVRPTETSAAMAVRDDWSAVADILRTHPIPISLDMRVTPIVSDGPASVSPSDEAKWLASIRDMPFMNVGDEAERRAFAYFNQLRASAGEESKSLGLSVVLWSKESIPALLANTVRYELYGAAPADVERVDPPKAHAAPTAVGPSEVMAVFHPPYGRIQGRGLTDEKDEERSFRGQDLPAAGSIIGSARVAGPRADRRVDVPLDESARSRHVYVVGRTGTGKTNLLKELCRQDIETGRGLAVLDPHGDLVDYLAKHCQARVDETVLLDFGEPTMVPLFNPLLVDVRDPRSQGLHTTDFLRVLEARYYNEFTGPVFDDMIRQALETIFEPTFPGHRSIDVIEAMYRNREIRRRVAQTLPQNSVLRDRWNVFEALAEKDKAERVTWMLSKFADLMPQGSPLRLALCSTRTSPLSIEQVIWRQGVLLIKIPEAAIGPDAASFLGSLMLRRIQRAVFDYRRGTGSSPDDRPVFTLCIDEFQKFATAGLEELVAEARKFGCGLVLAHQNLEQLHAFSRFEGQRSRELLNALLGNVGTMVAFRAGPSDATTLATMLQTEAGAFDRLPKYKALARVIIDADDTPCFTLTVPDAERLRGTPAASERLRTRMIRDGYWLDAKEAEGELSGHVAQFEAAVEHTAPSIRAADTALLKERQALVETGRVDLDDMAEWLGGAEGEQAFLRDIAAALVAHHVMVAPGVQTEVAKEIAEIALPLVGAAPETINPPDRKELVDGVAQEITALMPPSVAISAFRDALRAMAICWITAEPASPEAGELNAARQAGLALFEGLLVGFVGEELDPGVRRRAAQLIASGAALDDLDAAGLTETPLPLRKGVAALIAALRAAAQRAPGPTVWSAGGRTVDLPVELIGDLPTPKKKPPKREWQSKTINAPSRDPTGREQSGPGPMRGPVGPPELTVNHVGMKPPESLPRPDPSPYGTGTAPVGSSPRRSRATKPATTKPATTKPATTKPATTKPAAKKPATTKPPAAKGPAATKPAAKKPAAKPPAAKKPAAKKPAAKPPAAKKPAATKQAATKPARRPRSKPAGGAPEP